jgi:allophanate hydrolase subunit 2
MDTIAHAIANALVGNKRDAIVLEMHIPAAEIVFNKETPKYAEGKNSTIN